jgi:hypothetical protein
MDINKNIDHLLKNKNYQSLSDSEKKLIDSEIGGEKAFNELSSLIRMTQKEEFAPKQSKAYLIKQFKAKNRSIFWLAGNYKIPAYSLIPFSMILILIFFLLPSKTIIVEQPKIVQLAGSIDTVIVHDKADTVFIETQKRVEVPIYITEYVEKEIEEREAPVLKGSTISDQAILNDFIISAP